MTDYNCWGERELIEELEKRDDKIEVVLIEVMNNNIEQWEWYGVYRNDNTETIDEMRQHAWLDFTGGEKIEGDTWKNMTRTFTINI